MTIEIKKSVKPIKYKSAIDILEDRLEQIKVNKNNEQISSLFLFTLIWSNLSSSISIADLYFIGFTDFLISIVIINLYYFYFVLIVPTKL